MKSSFKIFSAFGIPVELHISFLLLMLFIYFIAFLGIISVYIAFLITLLFVTVVVHELSHSYVAKRYGVKVGKIVLLPIGGVSAMEEIPKDPDQELKIAAAGPLANILIALACFIALLIIGGVGSLTLNSFIISNTPSADLALFLANFLGVNLVLGLFNLLPAFPMDGGRVLRAFFAKRMNYVQATKRAASVGKQFAILMIILGIFFNFILILIAIFIYLGADQEYKNIMISSRLEGINVRDIMTKEVKTLTPDTSVTEALNTMFKQRHMGYPVADHGELVGIVTFDDISKIPENQRDKHVEDIMTKELILANPDEPAMNTLEKITRNNIGRLPVTENGNLVGIISKTDIMRILEVLNTKQNE
ncbi:CBS domain-containing protein [Methanobacterium sp.]|uniref:CBS domain-containing protein n=1 Tax=Methanobacterium sp. TaxID=2164 RepID=UPI003C71A668